MNNDDPHAHKLSKWLMRNNKSSLPGLRLPTVPWTSVIASPVRCRHGHGLEYFSSSLPFGQQMPQATSLIPTRCLPGNTLDSYQ